MSRTENVQISVEAFIILGSSLLVGFLAGVYIFFTSGIYDATPTTDSIQEIVELEIVADEYGGCERSGRCASFRIDDRFRYTYVVPMERGSDVDRYEGRLSAIERSTVSEEVSETAIQRVVSTRSSDTCPDTYDGSAYRIAVTIDGEQYNLDSCVHDLSTDRLFQYIINLFNEFALKHGVV